MGQPLKVAIMQPYFLPYIGYWQLMNHADVFVVYDDIEYTKKGWINRNRFLMNGQPEPFSLPIKSGSDFLDVRDRQLSTTFCSEKIKIIRRLEAAYRKAPHFEDGNALIHAIFSSSEVNLFRFLNHSIELVRAQLGITSRLIVSSTLGIPRELRGQARVIATCKALKATDYINPLGGLNLYGESAFLKEGVRLHFQKLRPFDYQQFQNEFIPNLSIIDNIMFLGIDGVRKLLPEMDLIKPIGHENENEFQPKLR